MNPALADIQPVQRRNSIGADIAAQLQRLILDGTYPTGTILPSQRELARRFGASVPSVREAISVLTASGMLETRTGHGTVVRSLTTATSGFDGWLGLATSDDELQDLIEARRILEQFTLRAAATTINAEHRQLLYAILEEMRAALDHPPAYIEADIRLHMTIADIAGNRVVSRLMRIIQTPLRHQIRRNVERLYQEGRLTLSLADHQVMLDALCAGDPDTAFLSINKMLARVEHCTSTDDQPTQGSSPTSQTPDGTAGA